MKRLMMILCMLWCGLEHLILPHTAGAQQFSASALTANVVRQHVQEHQEFIFVDIRPSRAFEQIRIPGALNIPLFAMTTKTFLRGKSLVLVDEGDSPRRLADACEQLAQADFEVRFLFGGLAAWQASGGRMQGNAFVRNTLNRLSPQAFFVAREHADWLVIDASAGKLPAIQEPGNPIFPAVRKIPFQRDRPEQFVTELEHAATQASPHPEWLLVLIFNQDGSNYEAIERALRPTQIAPIFFLEGGLRASVQYAILQNHLSQEQRRKSTDSCCQSCACSHFR